MNERSFRLPALWHCPKSNVLLQTGAPKSLMLLWHASPNTDFTKPACRTLVPRPRLALA